MVISIVNQKGGCGKTTSTMCLAYSLHQAGKKVLVIDLDAQANLTEAVGLDLEEVSLGMNVAKSMLEEQSFKIYPMEWSDVVPSSIDLSMVPNKFMGRIDGFYLLRNLIDEVRDNYDYILIDCPPSLEFLVSNALNASDGVIIPLQSKPLGIYGLNAIESYIASIQKSANKNLKILGLITTMTDNTVISREVSEELKNNYEVLGEIPRTVSVVEMTATNDPKGFFDGKSKAAEAYNQIAKKVMAYG